VSAASDPTEQRIAAALARRLGTEPADVYVQVADVGADVPGLVLFVGGAPVGRRSWSGVFDGTEVDLDRDSAMSRVLAAWDYGPARTRSAREVAAAAGFLEAEPGLPYLDEQAIEDGGRPEGVTLPSEVEVDGIPAVQYWNSSDRRMLWQATLVAHPGHRAEYRPG
jgi:hypothetical protein